MARQLSEQDRDFIMQARPMGLAEVKMSQMARDYASRAEVRKFAERMLKDHGDANKQLLQIMRKIDIDAPDQPDEEHRELMEELYELEGEEFDKEYVRTQLSDHEHHLELYEREAQQGQDPEMKKFAQGCVPILQSHLQEVKALASTLRA